MSSWKALYKALIQESAKSISTPHYISKTMIKAGFKTSPSSSPILGIATLAELRFRNILHNGTDTEPPLSPKSSNIKYSIGDVLFHKGSNAKVLVVAYDTECRASKAWQASRVSHPKQAFYTVLVDVRDCPNPTIAYVAQDSLMTVDMLKNRNNMISATTSAKVFSTMIGSSRTIVSSGPSSSTTSSNTMSMTPLVLHPALPKYFSSFASPSHYIMTSALRNLYPHDALKVPLLLSIEARAKALFDSIQVTSTRHHSKGDDDNDNDDGEAGSSVTSRRLI